MFEAIRKTWADLVHKVLPWLPLDVAEAWEKWCGIAFILAFVWAFFRGIMAVEHEWLEYVPAGVISEVMLIHLIRRHAFKTFVQPWKLAVFPAVIVWLPYGIHVLASPALSWLKSLVEKITGWPGIPQLAAPCAYGHGLINTFVCFALTMVVFGTAFFEKHIRLKTQ